MLAVIDFHCFYTHSEQLGLLYLNPTIQLSIHILINFKTKILNLKFRLYFLHQPTMVIQLRVSNGKAIMISILDCPKGYARNTSGPISKPNLILGQLLTSHPLFVREELVVTRNIKSKQKIIIRHGNKAHTHG